MQGRKAETIQAVRQSRAAMPDTMLLAMPGTDWLVAMTYPALIRFGLWDEILAEPAPDPKLVGLTGAHLYATTVALAAKGQIDSAKAQLAALERHAGGVSADDAAGLNTLPNVLAVAVLTAQARIARAEGRTGDAITLLRQAVVKEDRLAYNEPADWFTPNRHELGTLLLEARRPKEAEAVFRQDLKRNPENGWALLGLTQALAAQGREQEANAVRVRFNRAWQHADIRITAAAF
jgi:tetratricopeptide (TPR) repeat protein